MSEPTKPPEPGNRPIPIPNSSPPAKSAAPSGVTPGGAPTAETPAQRRERFRATVVGIVAGGFIGITLGMIVVSSYRSCRSENVSPPEPMIKALPPRPAAPSPTATR